MVDAEQACRTRRQQSGQHKGGFSGGAERAGKQGGKPVHAGEKCAAADGGIHCHPERNAERGADGAAAQKSAGEHKSERQYARRGDRAEQGDVTDGDEQACHDSEQSAWMAQVSASARGRECLHIAPT